MNIILCTFVNHTINDWLINEAVASLFVLFTLFAGDKGKGEECESLEGADAWRKKLGSIHIQNHFQAIMTQCNNEEPYISQGIQWIHILRIFVKAQLCNIVPCPGIIWCA